MKTKSKTTAKSKAIKKEVLQEQPKRTLRVRYILGRIISLPVLMVQIPLHAIYLIFFKVPSVPSHLLGLFRFLSFLFIMMNTSSIPFQNWAENIFITHGLSQEFFKGVLCIYAIVILGNFVLSFMEICGLHDPKESGYCYDDDGELSSNSGYDSFDKVLEYRDSLLKAKHTPGKIEELKKTGFITKERLLGVGQSEEVSKALELANSQMRAMHTPDKYKFLQGLFGGK
jgi:hypothetical protein